MPSRDQNLWWNLLGASGNAFDSPRAVIYSSSTHHQGMLHSWNQSAKGGNAVRDSTGEPVARSEERNRETIDSNAEICKETINHKFFLSSRRVTLTELRGWSTKTSDLDASVWQIHPHFHRFSSLEDKIQNPSKFLFRFSLGGNVMDHGSGDARFGGRFENFRAQFRVIFICRTFRCWMRELRLLWTRSFRIPSPRRRSVSRNRKKIGFFAADRSLTWSATVSWLLAVMRPVLDYADLFTLSLRNDDVQEFDTTRDETLSSMTKIPTDDVLESLYKLRIREPDRLNAVLEVDDMEIHQKVSMPDYQNWRQWWREA